MIFELRHNQKQNLLCSLLQTFRQKMSREYPDGQTDELNVLKMQEKVQNNSPPESLI